MKQKFGKYGVKEFPLLATEIHGNNLSIVSKMLFDEKVAIPKLTASKSGLLKFDTLKIKPTTKFLLFGGKGGVGKTSCAAAVALQESRRKKVLIFSTDPAHSLSDSFGVKIGYKTTAVTARLDAMEIDASRLWEAVKQKYKKEIQSFFSSVFKSTTTATIDAPYDRKVMEDLFDLAPPGIDEIMALKTIMDLLDAKKYDLFVLDTAPTGHTIRLLEMPEMAEEWVKTLIEIQDKYPLSFELGDTLQEMLDTIKKVRKMLAAHSEFVIVAIPEAMSVLETQDLVAGLKRLNVAVSCMVVNKIVPASSCSFCSAIRSQQIKYIDQLRKLNFKIVGVELFDTEIQGTAALKRLGTLLE